MPRRKKEQNLEQRHDEARELSEEALGAYAEGDKKEGDRLADKAKNLDPDAVREVVEEIDEDAGSDHNVGEQNKT